MEITKREVIASIVIIALMLIFGLNISGNLSDSLNDKNAIYQKAIHIDDPELFLYGMKTNVGNAFVYGELIAVDPVTFDEINGQYIWIKKTEEHYNKHTRTVTKTKTVNGKTKTYHEIETYYSWDYYDSWSKESTQIKFCGSEFNLNKISLPHATHIDTQRIGLSNVRYIYQGIPSKHTGTIYTNLKDGTISDNSKFWENETPESALKLSISNNKLVLFVFWILWILLIIGIVLIFYYFKNQWLE